MKSKKERTACSREREREKAMTYVVLGAVMLGSAILGVQMLSYKSTEKK